MPQFRIREDGDYTNPATLQPIYNTRMQVGRHDGSDWPHEKMLVLLVSGGDGDDIEDSDGHLGGGGL